MARPPLLSESDVNQGLASCPDWERKGAEIYREFTAADFASAVGFINAVAIVAEKADHHPDISLHGWNKVRINLSTHDQGGLTHLDFDLAEKIDAIAF